MNTTLTPDSQRVVPADLLPCPFCNAEPAYFSGTNIQYGHGESSDYAGVRCSVCRVEISFCNYAGYQLTERMALAAEKWNRRAPAASPPVAPLEDAQEGVVAWRYVQTNGFAWKWNDGAPTTAEYENAGDETIELAYSRPPAQTQGELDAATDDLVNRFAVALKEKLLAAQRKYGYASAWTDPTWMDECRAKLIEHVGKGDPRDVAAYCAFLWHHGERTELTDVPPASSEDRVVTLAEWSAES